MNKLFAIAFMCIYLLMSVGVAKTTHYCMGRAKSTQLFSFESKKCPCSVFLPENNACCADEHELLIVDDSQTPGFSLALSAPGFFPIGKVFEPRHEVIIEYTGKQFFTPDFDPPPREQLFKTYCSYVFYDDYLS